MSLVEVMVAFAIFAIAAGGVVSSLVQAHKLSVNNLAQSYANSMAQTIIEEVTRMPTSQLTDLLETHAEIKLAKLTTKNATSMDSYLIPWAPNDTDFTQIGTTADGVLTDAAYVVSSNTIRPERFMPMRVNLRRTVEESEHRIRIVLRFQWAIPDRSNPDGTPMYQSDEIRTVRSTALRF